MFYLHASRLLRFDYLKFIFIYVMKLYGDNDGINLTE